LKRWEYPLKIKLIKFFVSRYLLPPKAAEMDE